MLAMTEDAEIKRSSLASCTCMLMRKASRRVSQIYDQHLERHGLTITQFGLLANLKGLDGISIGGLADKLVMDPTTLTRNLRPLERQGLVAPSPDPNDRRSVRLHLTDKGREAFRAAKPAWAEAQRHIEDAVGSPDMPQLRAAIDHMLKRLTP
jgi:DNA-binding MarR family transcriptional regulator